VPETVGTGVQYRTVPRWAGLDRHHRDL